MDPAGLFCLPCILLIPMAAAGLALINTGLGRSRNAAHSLLGALLAVASAGVAYFAVGFSWQGYPGGAHRVWIAAGREWNWIGWEPFLLRGVSLERSGAMLPALFGLFAVSVVAIIPLGSGAERWRLRASCASAAMLAGFVFPAYAHWAWGGGWLAGLGFVDGGGAGSIHAVGGAAALAVDWILGPRRGKYSTEGMPGAIPGHSAVLVLTGCLLTWIGWLGLDGAGVLLFGGVGPARLPLVAVNATLSAGSGVLIAAGLTRARFGKVDASLCANGWVAGLVATSAGCAVMRPVAAVLCGLVGGALVIYAIEWLELYLTVDDPGGAISVHLLGGLWSVMAVGLFAPGKWLAQTVGCATLLGFVLPLVYGCNLLLNRIAPMRAAPEAERQGLDLHELGAGAYPEFLIHGDDW